MAFLAVWKTLFPIQRQVHRQERGDDWFRLPALAPIDGAYDFGGPELPALLDGTVRPPYHVGYTAYLVVAWNRLHEQTGGVIHLERPHPAGLINYCSLDR